MKRFRSFDCRRPPPIVTLLILLLGFSVLPALAQPPAQNPAFVDGHWIGAYAVIGTAHYEGATVVNVAYTGNLDFISAAGEVSGGFDLGGVGDITMPESTGLVQYAGQGEIFGPSDAMQMLLSALSVDVQVNVMGVTYSDSVAVGTAGALPVTILLISATCSQAVGDIETPVVAGVQSAGGQVQMVSGSFTATREEDLAAEDKPNYYVASAELIHDAFALTKQAQEEGEIDFAGLEDLLERAEDLSRVVKHNTECGLLQDPSKYLSPISLAISHLVAFAVQNAEEFTASELSRLIVAALRTGVIGAGAVDAQTADKFEEQLTTTMMEVAVDAELLAQEGQEDNDPEKLEEGCQELADAIAALTLLGVVLAPEDYRYDVFCVGGGGG